MQYFSLHLSRIDELQINAPVHLRSPCIPRRASTCIQDASSEPCDIFTIVPSFLRAYETGTLGSQLIGMQQTKDSKLTKAVADIPFLRKVLMTLLALSLCNAMLLFALL
jgi:hypothetical protein